LFVYWKLAAYFDKLAGDPGASLRGVTGVLRIDSQGLVQRDPAWAVFSGGRPRLAPNGAPIADATPGH
jgi:outer membrane PBP1 activator LpoA protein